jgi:hypothetical protein
LAGEAALQVVLDSAEEAEDESVLGPASEESV